MRKLFTVLVSAGIIFLAYLMLNKDQTSQLNQQVTTQTPVKPTPVTKTSNTPDKKEIVGNWPGIAPNDRATVLEKDPIRKNFFLIFDGSGSMSESRCSGSRSKSDVAKDAVKEWSSSVPADANLGLIAFDQQGLFVRLPLGLNNRDRFRQEIENIIPDYKTPLTASINQTYQLLTEQGRRQLGYGEYTIVVVTDGAANKPDALTNAVNSILVNSPIIINTIGFCIQTNHSLNQPGRTVYKAADNPQALRQGLQEILAESESFDTSAFQ